MAAVDVGLNLVVLGIPQRAVWRERMARRTKVCLIVLFSGGLLLVEAPILTSGFGEIC